MKFFMLLLISLVVVGCDDSKPSLTQAPAKTIEVAPPDFDTYKRPPEEMKPLNVKPPKQDAPADQQK